MTAAEGVVGRSPDAVIRNDEGLIIGGLEIKCLKAENHIHMALVDSDDGSFYDPWLPKRLEAVERDDSCPSLIGEASTGLDEALGNGKRRLQALVVDPG